MEDATNRAWLTKEEAEAFIGKNSPYYLDKWKTYSESKFKGWNWASFIFGIQWMTYRRMYIEALLYYFFIVIAGIIISLTLLVFGISVEGNLLRSILQLSVGFFGNAIYRKKALRVLRKTMHLGNYGLLTALQSNGGVSIIGVIVGILLQMAVAFLLVFLMPYV